MKDKKLFRQICNFCKKPKSNRQPKSLHKTDHKKSQIGLGSLGTKLLGDTRSRFLALESFPSSHFLTISNKSFKKS